MESNMSYLDLVNGIYVLKILLKYSTPEMLPRPYTLTDEAFTEAKNAATVIIEYLMSERDHSLPVQIHRFLEVSRRKE